LVISYDQEFLNTKNLNSGIEIKKTISIPEFFFNDTLESNREHSKGIDQFLGFRILKIERKLVSQYRPFFINENEKTKKKQHNENGADGESWIGLNPQVLLTPYTELYEIFFLLKDFNITSIIDIGCAYGRVGIVARAFFPEVQFTGYEIVKKRIIEANRINDLYDLNMDIQNQNVLDDDFYLPDSSIYFIYDFSHFMHIKKVLSQIEAKINNHPFILIAKGEDIRGIIQLFFPAFLIKHEPIYKKNWSIFFLN
jgi:SAM-dependent methyltransferase